MDYGEYDYDANTRIQEIDHFWHPFEEDDIAKSTEACKNKEETSLGNELEMIGTKITTNFLQGSKQISYDNGTVQWVPDEETPYMVYAFDSAECMKECTDLCGKCGAWSFDNKLGICFLHTVDACCIQTLKQEPNRNFTSGYYCNQCWSTKGICPCSETERLKNYPAACKGVGEHSSGGATKPEIASPSALLRVDPNGFIPDPCACQNRDSPRRGCRCMKPQCKNPIDNPSGTCEERSRCRSRAYNEKRFPLGCLPS